MASGQLEERLLSEDETRLTYCFSVNQPTPPIGIGLVVASLGIEPDQKVSQTSPQAARTYFAPRGRMADLTETVSSVGAIIDFHATTLDCPFPHPYLQIVFLPEPYSKCQTFAGLIVLSSSYLHSTRNVDQIFNTRRALTRAIARQYFCHHMGARRWEDHWIGQGLTSALTHLYLTTVFGKNSLLTALRKEFEFVVSELKHEREPVYNPDFLHPEELLTKFCRARAGLVFHNLRMQMGDLNFRRILTSIFKPGSGGVVRRLHSTASFLKNVQLTTGQDTRFFGDLWIYGNACRTIDAGFVYNKRKHAIEFACKQNLQANFEKVSGQFMVRIYELDAGYDHPVRIDEECTQEELPCYSRSRKRKRRKDGGEEEAEVEDRHNDTPVYWIRLDPDHSFFFRFEFRQAEFMWRNQLEKDLDVVAQIDAIQALEAWPSLPNFETFRNILENDTTFYAVRLAAAGGTVTFNSSPCAHRKPSNAMAGIGLFN